MKLPTFMSVLALLVVGACGDDEALPVDARVVDAAIDADIDAAIDAAPGPCGARIQMTGEYIDWVSTIANFDGVENTTWQVVTPPGGAMATTAPNGRIILCIDAAATSQIDVTQGAYFPARFVADPAVFDNAGRVFSVRGLKTAMAAPEPWTAAGLTFDASAAQVLVYKIGPAVPLTLAPATQPAQRSFVSDGDDDITWTEGTTGALTLFPNRPVGGGTATLHSTGQFTGPTSLPLAAGRFTIVVIR